MSSEPRLAFADVLAALEACPRPYSDEEYGFVLDAQGRVRRGRASSTCPCCGFWLEVESPDGTASVRCGGGCDPSMILAELGLAEDSPAEPTLRESACEAGFQWAAELSDPKQPKWVLESYVARGALTVVAGKAEVETSSWARALAEAVAAELPSFLGRGVRGGPVVYLSERPVVDMFDDPSTEAPIRVLTRDSVYPTPLWAVQIEGAVAEAKRVGAVLVVIDALSLSAEVEEEKHPGTTEAVLDVLQAAAQAGLAVVLVHHERWAPGERGDALRTLFGATDMLIELERLDLHTPSGRHQLVALPRWPTPTILVADEDPTTGAWRVVSDAVDRTRGESGPA